MLLLYLASIKVKLLLNTETHIELSPSISDIKVVNNEPATITFDVKVDSLSVCNVMCTHTLIDTSQGLVVKNFTELAPDFNSYTYTLETPTSGSGQVIYNYKISCVNTEKSLCPSTDQIFTKSAFVTVDYSLSTDEVILQSNIQNRLNDLLSGISIAQNNIDNSLIIIDSLNYFNSNSSIESDKNLSTEETKFLDLIISQNNSLVRFKDNLQNILVLFEQEQFYEVDESLKSLESEFLTLSNKISQIKSDIKTLHSNFVSSIDSLNSIYENSSYYSNMTAFFNATNNLNFAKINSLDSSFSSYVSQVSSKSFSSFDFFNVDVSTLVSDIKDLDLVYQGNLSIVETQGWDLFDMYESTYELITKKEISNLNTVCDSLNSMLDTITVYNSGVDLSSLNYTEKDNIKQYSDNFLQGFITQDISLNDYFIFPTKYLTNYIDSYCNLTPISVFTDEMNIPNVKYTPNVELTEDLVIPKPKSTCCFQGDCSACCEGNSCDEIYPIVLVHGHSFSKSTSPELAFTRLLFLQNYLSNNGYISASVLGSTSSVDNITDGTWGETPNPLVIAVTYYYISYHELGSLDFVTRKTDGLENYAIRLNEAIELVKEKTGRDKVTIIAHSMGGLVSREYIKLFGEDSVNKLIILGSPDYGVEGDVRRYCTLTGAKSECEDMYANSIFLTKLNNPKNYLKKIPTYTIAASGCEMKSDLGKEMGDGVVLVRNVALPFAENHIINGTCTDFMQSDLHMRFVNPNIYPETYDLIKQFLKD